ncbi:hypothetical protein [Methylophilus sp. DW102]|uniref:hypothetical protein n=1 Tax=Methylophilus sp. DW102 TaxID=3095607 RepID=UPI00308E5658|nr:hypothetical protein MTDW_12760 [Methylophilus sp. DW102]BEV09315.1 hypothetical protein MTDW_26150 [Methylophilus sp. DW102]
MDINTQVIFNQAPDAEPVCLMMQFPAMITAIDSDNSADLTVWRPDGQMVFKKGVPLKKIDDDSQAETWSLVE